MTHRPNTRLFWSTQYQDSTAKAHIIGLCVLKTISFLFRQIWVHAIAKQIGTIIQKINACFKGGGGRIFKREILLFQYRGGFNFNWSQAFKSFTVFTLFDIKWINPFIISSCSCDKGRRVCYIEIWTNRASFVCVTTVSNSYAYEIN